jgi:hypothetical protein
MGDHAKNLFGPRPIAIDFLASGRHVDVRTAPLAIGHCPETTLRFTKSQRLNLSGDS